MARATRRTCARPDTIIAAAANCAAERGPVATDNGHPAGRVTGRIEPTGHRRRLPPARGGRHLRKVQRHRGTDT